jgi:hypothetical protein
VPGSPAVLRPGLSTLAELQEWLLASRYALRCLLHELGAVVLAGLPVRPPQDFAHVRDALISERAAYKEKATPRSDFGDDVYSSTDFPAAQAIRPHWRTTAGATGLAAATREQDCFLAARQLRAALNLPDQVFVHVEGEVKPCYADLTSPVYARILCKMLRSATRNVGPGAAVTITEMLPGPDRAWLTDAAGRHYSSELRLHLVDPASPAQANEPGPTRAGLRAAAT